MKIVLEHDEIIESIKKAYNGAKEVTLNQIDEGVYEAEITVDNKIFLAKPVADTRLTPPQAEIPDIRPAPPPATKNIMVAGGTERAIARF